MKIVQLLLSAHANDDDNDAHAQSALGAIGEALALDPADADALALKAQITGRLERKAQERAAAEKQAKVNQLLATARDNSAGQATAALMS